MVIIKSWCLLENCVRGEATDVGVTHSSSSVARQEAVLGRCAFATWVGARLQVQFAAAVTWISLNFQRYLPIGISFHITVPSIHSEKRLFEQVKWMVHSNSWVKVQTGHHGGEKKPLPSYNSCKYSWQQRQQQQQRQCQIWWGGSEVYNCHENQFCPTNVAADAAVCHDRYLHRHQCRWYFTYTRFVSEGELSLAHWSMVDEKGQC